MSFTAAGAHPIKAIYSGSAAFGGSTSAVLTQTVNDQRIKTVETIGKFMSQRNNLLLSNEPDADRQIDRLIEAGHSTSTVPGGEGYASNGAPDPIARLGGGPDATNIALMRFGLQQGNHPPPPAALGADGYDGDAVNRGATAVTGPLRVTGNTDNAMNFSFATSLSQIMRYSAEAEQKKAQDARLGDRMALGAGMQPFMHSSFSPLDIWLEGKYSSFRNLHASDDLDGHIGLVSVGADYVLSRSLLVGLMVQFDSMTQRSNLQVTEASGFGWMAGPYATVRLSENLFWQARAAWGQSNNKVSPFQTYTDEFDTNRWLVSSRLTGRWAIGPWTVKPSMSVAYIEDVSNSYADTFGVMIPEVRSQLGQAKAGPELGYHCQLSPDITLEPVAGLQVIWNFAGGFTSDVLGEINGENAGPAGARGRANLGLRAISYNGIRLDLSGSYDGIGIKDYDAFIGRATVQVPLN